MCWLDSREDLGQGIWADPSPIHLQPVNAWLGAGRPQGSSLPVSHGSPAAHLGIFSWGMKEQKWQESKPQSTSGCEASACTTPVTISLAKARHLAKLRAKGIAESPAHKRGQLRSGSGELSQSPSEEEVPN